jgi:beta-lactamase regulating signal transducer with metallopeptidase domain
MELTRYLVISTVCLLISYAAFRLIFRNSFNFHQQRVFLMSSIVFSIVLPFMGFRLMLMQETASISGIRNVNGSFPDVSIIQAADATGSFIAGITELLPYLYFIISAFFAVIMVVQLVRICSLLITSRKIKHGHILIFESGRVKSPFSFFSLIFLPANLTNQKERQSIIIHERVHSSQYHTLDNLIIETATAIMWFNPALWMMKKSLHLIHEYQADEGTLHAGVEKVWYQSLLLNQAAEENLISIQSGFNNKLLKKRMIMMMKNKVVKNDKTGFLSFIPFPIILLIAVFVLNGFFPVETKAQKKGAKNEKTEKITVTVNSNEKVTGSTDTIKIKSAQSGSKEEITVSGYAIQKHKDSQSDTTMNYILDGVSVKSISDLNPDSISSVNVIKEDRLIIIRTKNYEKKVKKINKPSGSIVISSNNSLPDNLLYIIDDKETSKDEFQKIVPSEIESISVIKGKEEVKKFTREDHDGVIIITTKGKKK